MWVLFYFCSLGWWKHMPTSCYSHWGWLHILQQGARMPSCTSSSVMFTGRETPSHRWEGQSLWRTADTQQRQSPLVQHQENVNPSHSIQVTLFPILNILNGQFMLPEHLPYLTYNHEKVTLKPWKMYLRVKDKLKLDLSSWTRTVPLGSEFFFS